MLRSSFPKGSKESEAEAIEKALNAIGNEGNHNGVTVTFGTTETGGVMETQGKHITVDWKALDAGVARYRQAGYKTDTEVEAAAEVSHEGSHVAQPAPPVQAMNRWDVKEWRERVAYRTQSYVREAGGSESIVWNSSWASSGDKETLRQNAVKEAAHDSVELSRQEFENRRNP